MADDGQGDLFSQAEIAKARKRWSETIKGDGGHCPVCDRWGRIYARHLNRTMVKSLLWLIGAPLDDEGYADVPRDAPRFVVRSNQLSTLKWWNMVESKEHDSGRWRATEFGKKFAVGDVQAQRTVFTYAGRVVAMSDERVFMYEVDPVYRQGEERPPSEESC